MSNAERVKEILSEYLYSPVTDMFDDSSIVDDLGADSLDVLEIIIDLEEEYAICIPDDEAEKLSTVGEIISWIDSHAVKPEAAA